MKITTIGIDLGKKVFQVHCVDGHGKVQVRKQLKRAQVFPFFANLPPCLIGMEACSGAHYWAQKLTTYGAGSTGHSHLMLNSFRLITNKAAFLAQSIVKQFIVAVNVLKEIDFSIAFHNCRAISNHHR